MGIKKIMYETDDYKIRIQKVKAGWSLQVVGKSGNVERKVFKYFETAKHYTENKYLKDVA
ncbi:hypothetical protein ACLIBH_07450 [Virgibacillus sp. W0430]|uniref:hypothetical protein n=1 Tax=Virgibacillus sp. W0430 TaxID=3391580 RepID=UPI003F46C2EE